MSDSERDFLTMFLLFVLGYGIWRAIHAASQADNVYRNMPGARNSVRNPLQTAKWMLVFVGLFLWLTVQGWFDPLAVVRPIFFIAASIGFMLSAIFLDRGYSNWWRDVRPYRAPRSVGSPPPDA